MRCCTTEHLYKTGVIHLKSSHLEVLTPTVPTKQKFNHMM